MKYKRIVLRKFFYMIFIDSNGKKLYTYLATVFGGVEKATDDPEEAYKSIQNFSTPCTLAFELSGNNNIIENIVPTDLTSNFFGQTEIIRNVWGTCTTLNTQTEISSALKDLYPSLYTSGKEAVVDTTNHKYLQLSQNDVQSHKCIVTEGTYKKENLNDTKKCKYHLSCPASNSQSCIDGLEAMNWIKLEIDLNSEILDKTILLSIEFDKNTKGAVFTPDITWYFAPPNGYIVSSESSVNVGNIKDVNAIQGVANETTCYFSEWTSFPESIHERNKSRVLFKTLSDIKKEDLPKLSNYKKIAVSLHLANPQESSNRQFFLGLFIAFFLAFCSDKTRINDFYDCLHEGCSCLENMCYCRFICNSVTLGGPVLLLLSFLSFLLPPEKNLKNLGKRHNVKMFSLSFARWISGIGVTLFLIFYVYFLWLLFPGFMHKYISCNTNRLILIIGALIALISNVYYLCYCFFVLKRKIYNYI